MATANDFFEALSDPSAKSIAKSILETLSFPSDLAGLTETLRSLQSLMPYVRTIDAAHQAVWDQWANAIPGLIQVADALERPTSLTGLGPASSDRKRGNRWYGRYKTLPLLSCLAQNVVGDPELVKRVTPAKSILLAFYRDRISRNDTKKLEKLDKLCDHIRRGHSPESSEDSGRMELLPPFEGHNDSEWVRKFEEMYRAVPKSDYLSTGVPDAFSPIRQLYWALHQLGKDDATDSDSQPSSEIIQEVSLESEPDVREEPSSSQHRIVRQSRSLHLFYRPPSNDEVTSDGLEPETRKAIIQPDTAADEPELSITSQVLEARYTNFRTALDNQRLPWAWDRLNPIETAILVKAVKEANNSESLERRIAAFLTWLMLAIGQHLSSLLQLRLGSKHQTSDGITDGGMWRRCIPIPPQGYTPRQSQIAWLDDHADFLDLQLPKPWPDLMTNLISQRLESSGTNPTLGEALSLSLEDAEKALRNFLESSRDRRTRLMPGRIRQALANELMQSTGDKVLTYIIAGLPTEMPPAGVYYTAYPARVAQRAYADAVGRIFKK